MNARLLVLSALAACGSAAPAPAASPAPAAVPGPPPAATVRAFTPTSFAVDVRGSGATAVILIPGLGCPGSVWDDTVAHLGASWQAHVLTLAGFAGQPALPGNDKLVATARDQLVAYIKDRKLDHPMIIGHSLGAFLALWVAETAPELVGPVVVVDGTAYIGGGDEAGARKFRDKFLASSDAEWAHDTRDMFSAMVTDKAKAEPMITAVLRSDRHAFANAFYELLTTDIRGDLPKITSPVLALLSDSPFAKMIEAQLQTIPHHTIKVLPKTRHFVMFDDPPTFFQQIEVFLMPQPRAK